MTLVITGPQSFSRKVRGFTLGASCLPELTLSRLRTWQRRWQADGQRGSLCIPHVMVTQATGTRGSWAGTGMGCDQGLL